jgi:ATP-binding cassette subfamily B protein
MNALSAVVALVPYAAVALIAGRLLAGTWDEGRALVVTAACAIGALVLRQALYIGSLGYAHVVEARLRRSLREQLVDHLGRVPLGWLGGRSSGELRRLVVADTAAIHTVVAHVVAEAAGAVAGVAASLVILVAASWRLALGYLLIFVVVAVAARAVAPRVEPGSQAEHDQAQAELAAHAVELAEGVSELKSFGLTGGFMERFRASLDRYSKASHAGAAAVARPMGVLTSAVLPGVLLGPMLSLCWAATKLGWASPSALVVFLLVGIGVPQTFFGSLSLVRGAQLGGEAAERICRFLDGPPLQAPPPQAPPPQAPARLAPFTRADAQGDIVFDRVSFGYDSAREVLNDVSFTVPAQGTVALVGPSGSGKTTLTRLLAGFWEPLGGAIRVGGRDVRSIDGEDLLRQVGLVFQDMRLASVSVRDNIRLARPDASEAEVVAAARAARIHDRVMALPRGYDTVVGSHDALLSGGERQRLCVARVFLQDAPVLVLDEATSFIDPETERALRDAFREFSSGRTAIVIAHRLSTITRADRIVVMDRGRVAEQGVHEELLAFGGLYRRLWDARAAVGALR